MKIDSPTHRITPPVTPPAARGLDGLAGPAASERNVASDDFRAGAASATRAAPAASATEALPRPVEPGSTDYYQQRHDDFVARNPGVEPPDYYLEYGDKYVKRFSELDSDDLTPTGLEWRDETLFLLQEKMEALRIEDPAAFAELERNPDAFRRFAYDTHPPAYVEGGLYDLPLQDLVAIGLTPDQSDIWTPLGVKQLVQAAGMIRPSDLDDMAIATGQEALSDLGGAFQSGLGELQQAGGVLHDRLDDLKDRGSDLLPWNWG